MNKYGVQYRSRTQVALEKRDKQQVFPLAGWVFDFPVDEVRIFLLDAVKKANGINLHTGLNIISELRANSLEEAQETSKNFAETTLNLISFSTLTSCSPARLVSILNILDSDAETCPFMQYVYPFDEQEIIGSLNVINEPTFREVFDAYTKSSNQRRILRALSWLRKGIDEENPVDEFVSYWIGLEVIKHILRRNLKLKVKNVGEWDGVKDVFTNKLHCQDFDTIREAGRNGLLHGFRELDTKFIKEIESYVEPVRKTLIFSLGHILGLQDSTILTITNKNPRRIRQKPWSVIKGALRNIPTDFDKLVQNYPRIDYEMTNKELLLEGGELSIKVSVTHHFYGPSGAKWGIRATELWGAKDSGIKQFTLDNIRIDKPSKSYE